MYHRRSDEAEGLAQLALTPCCAMISQAHDTRAAALHDALTQSMLECMTLHAQAETAASEVSDATCTQTLACQHDSPLSL